MAKCQLEVDTPAWHRQRPVLHPVDRHPLERRFYPPSRITVGAQNFIARPGRPVAESAGQPDRFYGIFAGAPDRPNSKYRARVTLANRGSGGRHARTVDPEERKLAEHGTAMTWTQRLKQVFGIDIETCPARGGVMGIIAVIEYPDFIEKILTHLDRVLTFMIIADDGLATKRRNHNANWNHDEITRSGNGAG